MKFRTQYALGERIPGFVCVGESMTKQEFAEECDINNIMSRYLRFGVTPPSKGEGYYGDFADVGDFLDAQIRVAEAQAQFDALPSAVRDRFGNSPARLLEFLSNVANKEEAGRLGLLRPEEKPLESVPPVVSPVVPPVAVPVAPVPGK